MVTVYDTVPNLASSHPDGSTSEPGVDNLLPLKRESHEDTAALDAAPTSDQLQRLGHAVTVRTLEQITKELGLPPLKKYEIAPREQRAQPLTRAVGEAGIESYQALQERLAGPLPTLAFAKKMHEPPVAEWAARRQRLDEELEARLAAIYQRTPWQQEARDRHDAWHEVGQGLLNLIPGWARERRGVPPRIGLGSALYLLETHSRHISDSVASALRDSGRTVAEGLEEFPYTAVAWADRQLTRFENVVYGFGRMVGSQAKHVGETRGWQRIAGATDNATGYALYGAVMGYAFTSLFINNPRYYLSSAAHGAMHLPGHLMRGIQGMQHKISSTSHGIAADSGYASAETDQSETIDQRLTELMERQGIRVKFIRVDLPGEPLSGSESHFAEEAEPLIAAHLKGMDEDTRMRIWITTHDVTAQAIRRVPGTLTASPAESRDVYRCLREMFPAADDALRSADIDMQAITSEVLRRLGVGTIDASRRLDVFTVMADFYTQVTVNSPLEVENPSKSHKEGCDEAPEPGAPASEEIFVPIMGPVETGGQCSYRLTPTTGERRVPYHMYRRDLTLEQAQQRAAEMFDSADNVEIADLGVTPYFVRRAADPTGQLLAPITTRAELDAYLAREISLSTEMT